MTRQNFRFWSCPDCLHARALNLERMTNRCRLIDQGESPVDGRLWEHEDHDRCPAFEANGIRQAPAFAAPAQSTPGL
ncbi:MAG TPA: hypothetical protein VI702_02995 [Nitrospiria bacterium]